MSHFRKIWGVSHFAVPVRQPVGVVIAGRTRRRPLVRRARTASLVIITAGCIVLPVAPLPARAGGSIQSEQDSVVAANYQGPMQIARFAVSQFQADVQRDGDAVAADQSTQAGADAIAAAAAARLSGDQSTLAADVAALRAANQQLALDRAQLELIAVGMYTGSLTNPQPASVQELQADQQQVIDADEIGLVAHQVEDHVRTDLNTSDRDGRAQVAAANQVTADQRTQIVEARIAQAAGARTATDAATLSADEGRLGQANYRLSSVQAELDRALAAVVGPGTSGLSILGGSALSAAQLAGWFESQGFVDYTSASISDLAAWYVQAGAAEGVRGDVAFAQAVLETAGFSSPDAIQLSNFAGIGHCDSCSSGWSFPGPYDGVIGHVELLRIFAAGSTSGAYPSMVPSQEISAACCSTVESLTGVWATDPTYGQQILDIYSQMLSYALANPAQ